MDNLLVGTKEKERHNKIEEEVVRKLAENNLYIKPEKCKWIVRKVRFLEVVTGSDGIKIEKEKVKESIRLANFQGVMGCLNTNNFIFLFFSFSFG